MMQLDTMTKNKFISLPLKGLPAEGGDVTLNDQVVKLMMVEVG